MNKSSKSASKNRQKHSGENERLSGWQQGQAERKARPWTGRIIGWMVRLVGVILAALFTVTLFLIGLVYYQGKRRPKGKSQYVAMGSSFAAGPGVGKRDSDSPILCMRSSTNYPHLLAKDLGLDLTDVTSSGATTRHILEGGQFFQPSQLDALRADTELVTITVGGNDIFYLGNLLAWSCQNNPEQVPRLYRNLIPAPKPDEEVEREIAQLPNRFAQIAGEVRRRAPHAKLVFVDYTTILPPRQSKACQDRLPLTHEQLERGRYVAGVLAEITAEAAHKAGAVLVRASEVSQGHDICSDDPWVFGFTLSQNLFSFDPVAYHPNEKAMRAIADAIKVALS